LDFLALQFGFGVDLAFRSCVAELSLKLSGEWKQKQCCKERKTA